MRGGDHSGRPAIGSDPPLSLPSVGANWGELPCSTEVGPERAVVKVGNNGEPVAWPRAVSANATKADGDGDTGGMRAFRSPAYAYRMPTAKWFDGGGGSDQR